MSQFERSGAVRVVTAWPPHTVHMAVVITSPRYAAAAALAVSCRDAASRRVSEHVGLPLAVSHRHLAIKGAAVAHAMLPHHLHAHILALDPEYVLPW